MFARTAGMCPPTPGFQWVVAAQGNFPYNAVACGRDSSGESTYVGRAFFNGDLIPGKVVPSHHCCYVAWGGDEHSVREYEVLTLAGGSPNWVPSVEGCVPPYAVQGGRTAEGEPLYIGRCHWDGAQVAGKVHPTHRCLYIPYGGREHSVRVYDALVTAPGGGGYGQPFPCVVPANPMPTPYPYPYPTTIPSTTYPSYPTGTAYPTGRW